MSLTKSLTRSAGRLRTKKLTKNSKVLNLSENHVEKEARYLYCVAESSVEVTLGKIGLDGNQVYTIPADQLCAVVHDCRAKPYDSDNEAEVKDWVKSHQNVLDRIMQDSRFPGLIPASFDTIIKADDDRTATENVKYWLNGEVEALKEQLQKVRGKEEYGVKITYDPDWLADSIQEDSEEFRSLKEKITGKSEGKAYLYREKLDKLRKDLIEEKKGEYISEFSAMIEPTVGEVRRDDRREQSNEKRLLLDLSCLVDQGEYEELGEALEKIDNREGFDVKFTGPWAPYSFTDLSNPKAGN